MELYSFQNISFSYPEQANHALRDVSLSVEAGEFLLLCGPSGCGKSTLLRHLKSCLTPHGLLQGEIRFDGRALSQISDREQAQRIGFVQQSPENQVVTDKVWHELAFGLESLGFDTPTIRRRVAEIAAFFDIEGWFYRPVSQLSGGQKQLLSLACVMAMQPDVLILDEPTAQLDPIAASEFLALLGRINREMGTTIILSEHRLEEAFAVASRVLVMDKGSLLCQGTPQQIGVQLKKAQNDMFLAMPAPMQVWAGLQTELACPVTARDGNRFLHKYAETNPVQPLPPEQIPACGEELVLGCDQLWFRYEKESPDVIRGLSLNLHKGEFYALMGGNGAGKSTLLHVLSGLLIPHRGEVYGKRSISLLPQNPQTLFVKHTVLADLKEVFRTCTLAREEQELLLAQTIGLCRLDGLLERHPYDLSGGEQQRAALAKVLLTQPQVLLLDEPTKGLDAPFKAEFASVLDELLARGISVLMVSHDVAFCAQYAHRCGLFFDGNVVAEGTPREFFSGNHFYTTSVNRMARDLISQAVTVDDAIHACGGMVKAKVRLDYIEQTAVITKPKAPAPLPLWRKVIAVAAALVALYAFLSAASIVDLSALIGRDGVSQQGIAQLYLYAVLLAAMGVFVWAIGRISAPPVQPQTPLQKRKLSRRTKAACAMILLFIPLTIFVGVTYFGGRHYNFTALLVLMECMLPFLLVYEDRKPQARELVTVAVLCAIGVAGKSLFFMLPQFKPVMALTIIAGVALGGETGFLVGAVTMLVSNLFFGQGPWTPWQMFSMGIIGFLAGVLFRKGWLMRSRQAFAVFGAFAAIFIYGGIMNPASALMWNAQALNWDMLLAYYVSGLPMDLIHAGATVIFLLLAAEPMLEKLDRIKVKYGLIE